MPACCPLGAARRPRWARGRGRESRTALAGRLCVVAGAALVGASSAPAQPGGELELPSCVAGSPPLKLPARAERALLDRADRRHFQHAAEARYPLYRRGGFVPMEVMLVRRGGQWQYLTLWPGGPAGRCVTAVFAAERFDFTEGWLGKYQPREADPAD